MKKINNYLDISILLLVFGYWYVTKLEGGLFIDSTIYARSGWLLVTGQPYTNPTHYIAPTAKYFIGFGQLVFGRNSFGVRMPIALFGLLTIIGTYKMGITLRNRYIGLVSAGLVGWTYFFARHSVMGMLDVPLTFFFVMLVYVTIRWIRCNEEHWGVLIGVLAAAVMTTKSYGFVYIIPPPVTVLLLAYSRGDLQGLIEEFRYPFVGGVSTMVLIYSPYLFIPHPEPVAGYGPFVDGVLRVPMVGNIAYIYGAWLVASFTKTGNPYAVQIMSDVFAEPPIWSYVYWLYEMGGYLYPILLSIITISTIYALSNRAKRMMLFLGATILFPLLILSLISIKFPRYILPVFPVVIVVGLHLGYSFIDERVSRGLRFGLSAETRSVFILVIVVTLICLASTSPVIDSFTKPTRTDTGYDDAAEFIRISSNDHTQEKVVVLTLHAVAIDYYLGTHPHIKLISYDPTQLVDDDMSRQSLQNRIQRGDIDFFITNNEPWLSGTKFQRTAKRQGDLCKTINQSPTGVLEIYCY